ncbi:MAG: hypothetical protein EOO77_46135 [Oxalobacteraceae bacterium]|nr:MAG: hypothetical protein EOO77_46135 [Oxalobacteraceae bacterium]
MYTVRLAEAVIKPSVSRIGDSYDHLVPSVSKRVLAETVNGRFKAEITHRLALWRSFNVVEYAALE